MSNIGRECALDILVENKAFHFFFKAFAKMGIRAEHFEQDNNNDEEDGDC